jgi:uncharacterized protein
VNKLNKIFEDKEYYTLVEDILKNKEFNEIDKIEHHGTSRMLHSMRVSYYSYLISKALRLHNSEVARGGLLHDFFMSSEERTSKDRFVSTFTHPKYAVKNADNTFEINDLERDIIKTHMFPVNIAIPKYLESWIVSLVDKGVATYEFVSSYKFRLSYASNYLYLFLLLSIISYNK